MGPTVCPVVDRPVTSNVNLVGRGEGITCVLREVDHPVADGEYDVHVPSSHLALVRNVTAFVPDGVASTEVPGAEKATIRLDGMIGVGPATGSVYERMTGPPTSVFDPLARSSTSIVLAPVGIPYPLAVLVE